jgi:hypothetical protein
MQSRGLADVTRSERTFTEDLRQALTNCTHHHKLAREPVSLANVLSAHALLVVKIAHRVKKSREAVGFAALID